MVAERGSPAGAARPRPSVELLAPAGDRRSLTAALAAGADAVYLGLDRWSARAFAGNFSPDELVPAIERAHLYGARLHLALNTLLKDAEIGPALAALEAPYEAGLDALIVADLGFAALVRDRFPDLELHASTQLNTHSSMQLGALADAGFTRAILARELSLDEILSLDHHGLQFEVFVHGALCYGYSGLCLFSSMVGGRSGNRGRCSQACRMRYRLVAGDAAKPASRVLSTGDLAAIGALPALVAAGVAALKIEGRMKDAVYVATATAVYREALDAALAAPQDYEVRPDWMRRLEQSFSRGFTTAHLEGRHADVRGGGRGGHRGVAVGRVEAVDDQRGLVTMRVTEALHDGDIVSVYTAYGQTEPVRVGAARVSGAGGHQGEGQRLTMRLRERVSVKDRVFRLSSAEVDAFAEAAVAGRVALRPLVLDARLEGRVGRPAQLTLSLAGRPPTVVTVLSEEALKAAKTAPLSPEKARVALAAMGGTPYALGDLDYAVGAPAFMAVGAIKELRRRALAELDRRRLEAFRRALSPAAGAAGRSRARPGSAMRGRSGVERQPAPLFAPSAMPAVVRLRWDERPPAVPDVAAWCLDLSGTELPERVAAAVTRLRDHGAEVRCRPPEILFDEDIAWWRAIAELTWDAVYARHAAHLGDGLPAILEYPLQGLNAETARRLRPRAVVASPEASLDEIAALAAALAGLDPPAAVEAVVFGRQQLLVSRDRLGVIEGIVPDPPPEEALALSLVDAKGFVFRAAVDRGGTRIGNARVTNTAAQLAELAASGVTAAIVTLADMTSAERDALAAHGVAGLAAFAGRERSTTGHLFRGVV